MEDECVCGLFMEDEFGCAVYLWLMNVCDVFMEMNVGVWFVYGGLVMGIGDHFIIDYWGYFNER